MASDIQIARMALAHVGDRFDISALNEASTEAEQVNLMFDHVRDKLLRSHPWNFAKKYISPAALSGTVPGLWTYMYLYPADALRVLGITNPAGREAPPLQYETGRNAADQYCVFTDAEDAEIVYVSRVTNPEEFDTEFTVAFSYALASSVAMALTGDSNIAAKLEQQAQLTLNSALEGDSSEGIEPSFPEASWITARVGTDVNKKTVFNS
tara:strand:+ start:4129 stop:4758 length:630 start_codon:yes stop_codon:yes gene_type:complete